MTNTNKISLGIVMGLVLVIGVLLGSMYISKTLGANPVANTAGVPVNLIGSQLGTTTTAVGFYDKYAATTTYPFRIGSMVDSVSLTLLATAASTTSGVNLSILGSNDTGCDTASTTSGILNPIITSDIRWHDVGSHVREVAGSSSLNSGTTTISWSPLAFTGREITLVDLDVECLAVQISASSTEIMSQFMTKSNKQ